MLFIDGDYTYDPKEIDRLLIHADGYDQIIGARDRQNISSLHRVGNGIINFAFNLLMSTHMSDVCSGMYLLKTEAAKKLNLNSKGFDVEVEVEVAAQMANLGKFTEIPVHYRKRIGVKKLRAWSSGIRILATTFSLLRAYNPLLMLSAPAPCLSCQG